MLALSSTWAAASSQPSKLMKPVQIGGVEWQPSFERARARAMREGKPILQLHLFGRLDEEFC
jgi:hypothetical protein